MNISSWFFNITEGIGIAFDAIRQNKVRAALTILGVAVLTSKGASGVQGASFIALVATLSVIPTIPVAGMALILGIDRFMSMFRALVNVIGNGVATLVVARLNGELDRPTLQRNIALS